VQLVLGAAIPLLLLQAGAWSAPGPTTPGVDVLKVQGVIDPALASYVRGSIDKARRTGATVILQLDSQGTYGDQALELARFIRSSGVPVVSWAGPSGARVAGGALYVFYAASLATMAPGAGIGPAVPFDAGTTAARADPSRVARELQELRSFAPDAGASPAGIGSIARAAVPARTAVDVGAVSLVASDLPDLLRMLDGRSISSGQKLATVSEPGRPVAIRFHEIGLLPRILHAVSTPTAVYVLLVLGVWALAFELTQPGFGIAGIGGALGVALAIYGLTVIPVHWLWFALMLAGMGLQGLDVAIRRLGVLTIGGALLFGAGSFLAWHGVSPVVDLSLWLVLLLTLGGAAFFGFGLTVALRARERVRTAQVGLVGMVGEARKDLDPEGAVYVKGALWRARTADGPIPAGAKVRVRGLDGLVLRVERDAE
jgi:membrane-bound serine protease (ClpP class)